MRERPAGFLAQDIGTTAATPQFQIPFHYKTKNQEFEERDALTILSHWGVLFLWDMWKEFKGVCAYDTEAFGVLCERLHRTLTVEEFYNMHHDQKTAQFIAACLWLMGRCKADYEVTRKRRLDFLAQQNTQWASGAAYQMIECHLKNMLSNRMRLPNGNITNIGRAGSAAVRSFLLFARDPEQRVRCPEERFCANLLIQTCADHVSEDDAPAVATRLLEWHGFQQSEQPEDTVSFPDDLHNRLLEIGEKMADLEAERTMLISTCLHPAAYSKVEHDSNTGNYDPSEDAYYKTETCVICGTVKHYEKRRGDRDYKFRHVSLTRLPVSEK